MFFTMLISICVRKHAHNIKCRCIFFLWIWVMIIFLKHLPNVLKNLVKIQNNMNLRYMGLNQDLIIKNCKS